MTDALDPTKAEAPATAEASPSPRHDLFGALAAWIARASTGDRAALRRLKADALQPHELAALAKALLYAGLSPDRWRPETWPRWALIAQGMALAGHASGQLGLQLARAGVSESRVTKLLTSRGPAFVQLLPRVLRLLASKSVAPNWCELGELVLAEADPTRQADAEARRLRIAGSYFVELAKSAKSAKS